MARLAVLTPNPAVDVTYRVEWQRLGQTNRVLDVARRAGGKGINTARVLAALGHEAVCVLPLGGPSGDWILSELASAGMAACAIPLAGGTRSTVAVTDEHGHPTMFAEPGPTVTADERAAIADALLALTREVDALVIAGSLAPGMPASDVGDWVAIARAGGIPVLVDAGGAAVLAAASAGADLVKPNRAELHDATGDDDVARGIHALIARGARTVVVSDGADGMSGSDRSRVADGLPPLHLAAVTGVTGNPTGAGDAASAALALALLDGTPLAAALARAAALGAAAVLRPLAGDVDLNAYAAFLSRYSPDGAHPR